MPFGDRKISILLYADDIAILSETPIEMQIILNEINDWCKIWKMKMNMDKTKVLEFRKKETEKNLAKFYLGDELVKKCNFYKYLGVHFNEFLDYEKNSDMLSSSGLRALGALIGKYKILPEMGYDTFYKCFNTYVCPIYDFEAEVTG